MTDLQNMTLYYKASCPYCVKVQYFMQNRGIEIPQKNAAEPEIADELVSIGGKLQVPCLVIDGKALYESDDIISYLLYDAGL